MSSYALSIKWQPDPGTPYTRMAIITATKDGLPPLTVVTPPEFKKGIPEHWNPEHLFVASAASCFFTTFLSIADASGLGLVSLAIEATGTLDKNEDGVQAITTITLKPRITVMKDADIPKAVKIVEKAEKNCLISNSMRTVVNVDPSVTID